MSSINKSYGYYELEGKEFGPHRVGIKTKLQYEKTSKARGWKADENPFTTTLFFVWHASQKEHGLSFEDFSAQVDDVAIVDEDDEAEDGELGLDPTQTGTGDAS